MALQKDHLMTLDFARSRRDVMLEFRHYVETLQDAEETFQVVTRSLADKQRIEGLSADRPMTASSQRASDAVVYIHMSYSGGDSIHKMRDFFLIAIDYWEEYCDYHSKFHESQASARIVGHMTLLDHGYWEAIRLTSFAILLGHTKVLTRICAVWDYGDQTLDGLLERLVAPYVPGRPTPPDKCTRHLPYVKLLKVFTAAPAKRPFLMAKYMDEWYEASRREPYYRSHTAGREHSYLGYWSFEAAAVTIVLDIDDSSYRDKDFYPKDLADFARNIGTQSGQAASTSAESLRLRCEAGEPCPRSGYWFTPARASSRQYFKLGQIMPDLACDYGMTIWQWEAQQGDPNT